MDQAGDFEGGEGIGETVEGVDAGGVLESETVLTEQGGPKCQRGSAECKDLREQQFQFVSAAHW